MNINLNKLNKHLLSKTETAYPGILEYFGTVLDKWIPDTITEAEFSAGYPFNDGEEPVFRMYVHSLVKSGEKIEDNYDDSCHDVFRSEQFPQEEFDFSLVLVDPICRLLPEACYEWRRGEPLKRQGRPKF